MTFCILGLECDEVADSEDAEDAGCRWGPGLRHLRRDGIPRRVVCTLGSPHGE